MGNQNARQVMAVVSLVLTSDPGLSQDLLHDRQVSEEAVRMVSAQSYSDILSRACLNGWRYSRSAIESGFERHFQEMKLVMVGEGHVIKIDVTADKSPMVQLEFDAKRRLSLPRQFGCFRPYWLDD
ncbi:hypothetical protein [Mesorhizobium sp. LjNodule214]|uniref:hypothetical protein n=1 Tax=Mesorhizobium sp. LjNodule214 TaxID=3342252 RepID=UPI003ECEC1DA